MDDLLKKIACCDSMKYCLASGDESHPCHEVVHVQKTNSFEQFSLPEPWSGELDTAKLLFVSSNPSIGEVPPTSPAEVYPNGTWSEDDIADYFNGRFGSREKMYIVNGTKSLWSDGSYGGAIRFWSSVKARARELFQGHVEPGVDYALTEVVHCKSKKEIGVNSAKSHCADLYMRDIFRLSGASVVVVLGSQAKNSISSLVPAGSEVSSSGRIVGPIEFFGKRRIIIYSPHPNARGIVKIFSKLLTDVELDQARNRRFSE